MRSDLTRLYDPLSNPPDPNGEDLQHIAAWMRANGLPASAVPAVVDSVVSYNTGAYRNVDLVFQREGYPPLVQHLYLFANNPETALRLLADYYSFHVVEPLVFVPPPPPEPDKPVKPPAPKRLVGDPCGDKWLPVAGDESPDGTEYGDERGTFVKHSTATPFGKSVYWTRR